MNAIIVEDEFPAREELKYFIKNHSSINILSEFDNGVDVLEFLQENEVDVIFLDINIPLLNGMVLAKTINKFINKPKIVFITAYKDYAVDAFELEAFDYVLKPYSEERIISTLNKLMSLIKKDEKFDSRVVDEKRCDNITLWKNEIMVVVNIEDIYYCEAYDRDIIIYTKENQYVGKLSIAELEKKLPSNLFFRIHRSYIVNLLKIKEIIPWFNSTYKIKFSDIKDEVYVSRSKIKQFRKIMKM